MSLLWWFLIGALGYGLVSSLSRPRVYYVDRPENEYDYDGGSQDCCDSYESGSYDSGGGDE